MTQDGTPLFKVFYGWYILAAAFLICTLGHGVQFSFGVFLKPLSETFAWSRSLTVIAFMLYVICRGISGTLTGHLTDRYGPRAIVAIGGILMGVGMTLGAVANQIWELYLFYGVLAGLGMGVVTVPLSATLSRWFIAWRGLAQGILVAGSGFGNLVFAPVAGYLILNFGLKKAFLLIGTGVLVLISLFSLVLRKEPADMQLKPYGAAGEHAKGSQADQLEKQDTTEEAWEISRVLRTTSFWLLAAIAFIFGVCLYTTTSNIVAYATDMGISRAMAPYLLSIAGASDLVGILVWSLVTEKIGARQALVICLGLQTLAMFGLAWASSLPLFCLSAAVFGFCYGGIALEILVITPEFFGMKSLGSITGLVFFIHLIGGAVGSVLGNLVYDFTASHSYGGAFLLIGAASIVSVIAAVVMRKPRPI